MSCQNRYDPLNGKRSKSSIESVDYFVKLREWLHNDYLEYQDIKGNMKRVIFKKKTSLESNDERNELFTVAVIQVTDSKIITNMQSFRK